MKPLSTVRIPQRQPPNTPTHKQRLGRRGEDLAIDYLSSHGYRIIERNFKARYGELDIIAVSRGVLVFIEVKTRIGHAYGKPEESVTPWKLREIIKTAQYYKLLHPELPDAMRADVIAIELDADWTLIDFNHIQNVTL